MSGAALAVEGSRKRARPVRTGARGGGEVVHFETTLFIIIHLKHKAVIDAHLR